MPGGWAAAVSARRVRHWSTVERRGGSRGTPLRRRGRAAALFAPADPSRRRPRVAAPRWVAQGLAGAARPRRDATALRRRWLAPQSARMSSAAVRGCAARGLVLGCDHPSDDGATPRFGCGDRCGGRSGERGFEPQRAKSLSTVQGDDFLGRPDGGASRAEPPRAESGSSSRPATAASSGEVESYPRQARA